MADVEDGEEPCALSSHSGSAGSKSGGDKMFSLKKWNAVAMWSWDVECDTCAICRVQVMGKRCTGGPGAARPLWAFSGEGGGAAGGRGPRAARVPLRSEAEHRGSGVQGEKRAVSGGTAQGNFK